MNDDFDDLHSPDDFDDPALGAALRALAPAATDGDGSDAYARALPRFVHARRRRQATIVAGSVAAGLLVVVGIGLSSSSSLFSNVRTTDPAGPGPSVSTDVPTRPTDGSGPDGGRTSTDPIVTTTTSTPGPPGASTTTTTEATGPPPNPTAPAGTREYSSAGGSVRVRIGDRAVTLLSNAPAPGYTADVRASGPAEVEVRFRQGTSGGTEHRIRLRFDANGQLQPEIT